MDQLLKMLPHLFYLFPQDKHIVAYTDKYIINKNKYPFLYIDNLHYAPAWSSVPANSRLMLGRSLFMGTNTVYASWSEQPHIPIYFIDES